MTRGLRWRLWLGRSLLPLVSIAAALVFAFLVLSPIAVGYLHASNAVSPRVLRRWLDGVEAVHWLAIQVLIGGWVFALGSSIASFLNVVAYRVPRGMSIRGRSHCPRCGSRLSIWDNMPIFGWLRHGGRCGSCHLPISVRYLWVEVILGSTFLLVFQLDVGTIHAIQAMQYARPELARNAIYELLVFAGDALLLSLLFVAALIQSDGARLPWRLVSIGWILCLSWLSLFPIAQLFWSITPMTSLTLEDGPRDLVGVGLAGLVALLLSLAFAVIVPLRIEPNGNNPASLDAREELAFSWIGAILNWSTVLITTAVAALAILVGRRRRRLEWPPFGSVFVASIVGMVWSRTFGLGGLAASPRTVAFWALGLIAFTIAASLVARSLSAQSSDFAD